MTEYPSSVDYVEAVQDPPRAFQLPELQRAEFPIHPVWRVPWPASGSAAVVFQARVEGARSLQDHEAGLPYWPIKIPD